MTGIAGSEVILLLLIGLVILGPQRLPKIASQVGSWVGQARRMTRAMKRQLEEEVLSEDFKDLKDLTKNPFEPHVPNDDDTYSPIHAQTPATPATPPSPVQTNAKASEVATPDDEGDDEELDTMPPPTARVRDAGEAPDETS